MTRLRTLLYFLLPLAVLAAPGCSPIVLCSIETEVYPDYTCARVTRMEAYPNPRYPNQRPRLGEYFQFPPAERYDQYVVQQSKVLFAGIFPSFEQVPGDLLRITPGATNVAGNVHSFRVMDLVLFVLADFDETLTDIVVSEEDGAAALDELVRLVVPEVMSVLNAKYGAQYDLSRLESWLYTDLPAKLQRVYAGMWAIHSAKRSGVTSPGEEYEFYMFLRAEALRDGLELAEPGHPDLQQENIRRLKDYGLRKAQSLVASRHGGVVEGKEAFQGIAVDELIASVQKAISARHGSVNNFIGKIASLVPRAFGAYLTGTVMPIYVWPETSYQFRLKIPGTIIQTNAVRELDGTLLWTFADKDLAFTGQSMWARTIFIREPAIYALGLRGFPASLADVDKMFGLCLNSSGQPREEVLKALGQSVVDRNLSPLQALAANPQAVDSPAAQAILQLFDKHRQGHSTQSQQPYGGASPAKIQGTPDHQASEKEPVSTLPGDIIEPPPLPSLH